MPAHLFRRAALLAVAVQIGAVAPAAAEDRVHRGVDGCIAWSWSEGGFATTAVYYSNRCQTARKIKIHWEGTASSETQTVGAKKKGVVLVDGHQGWRLGGGLGAGVAGRKQQSGVLAALRRATSFRETPLVDLHFRVLGGINYYKDGLASSTASATTSSPSSRRFTSSAWTAP
ncbi:hypothetical protein ABZ946_28585 [Streptomyces sp. NPDC046324]|uniref:hypothetical protein n=1 Tax=Streptomyces sp. NPDC046324 TaxID=3154915 RepID=UPI0033DDB398